MLDSLLCSYSTIIIQNPLHLNIPGGMVTTYYWQERKITLGVWFFKTQGESSRVDINQAVSAIPALPGSQARSFTVMNKGVKGEAIFPLTLPRCVGKFVASEMAVFNLNAESFETFNPNYDLLRKRKCWHFQNCQWKKLFHIFWPYSMIWI